MQVKNTFLDFDIVAAKFINTNAYKYAQKYRVSFIVKLFVYLRLTHFTFLPKLDLLFQQIFFLFLQLHFFNADFGLEQIVVCCILRQILVHFYFGAVFIGLLRLTLLIRGLN